MAGIGAKKRIRKKKKQLEKLTKKIRNFNFNDKL